jgi:hypothetical protein
MNIKETIIRALQESGTDTVTACALAQNKIAELKAAPRGRYVFTAGTCRITVNKA